MEQSTIVSVLTVIGFILLLSVTGGIVYLTVAEWRDRRRKDSDQKIR